MLSIKKLNNAKAATQYFEKDDYYAKDDPAAKEASQWVGKGAAALGLEGEVDPTVFESVLAGRLPNGTRLGRMTANGIEHAPGWDFTFSAPKSVSIMSEVGGDSRLQDAHEQAVKVALGYLEENAVRTRLTANGNTKTVDTTNLVAALFTHHSSRNQDPQLHTHSVIANATQVSNGEFRSIDSRELFRNKMLAGAIYRSELAYAARQHGYDVTVTHRDGRFELSVVPETVLRNFSSRRSEIENGLEASIVKDAKSAERVALHTRANKENVPRGKLREKWERQAEGLGFRAWEYVPNRSAIDFQLSSDAKDNDRAHTGTTSSMPARSDARIPDGIPPVKSDTEPESASPNETRLDSNVYSSALDAVRYAASKLANREAVFAPASLVSESLIHSIGEIRLPDVMRAIGELKENGYLIPATLEDGMGWTTRRAVYLEKAVIGIMKTGRESVAPIYRRDAISQALDLVPFKSGQYDAAVGILSTTDRIMGIQGYAGVGKTFMLDYVRAYAERAGLEVFGFAPSATAANELTENAHITSQTLALHLLKHQSIIESSNTRKTDFSNQLWIVDEAGMTGSQDMYDLLKLSELTGARVVLVGDVKQLGAVEAGKPFHLLQKAGMTTYVMKDIFRQKTKQALSAVLHSIGGRIGRAIEALGSQVREIENTEARLASIAKHYLSLQPAERRDTIVLTSANEDRIRLNSMIRDGLKHEGRITGPAISMPVLIKEGFTPVEKSRVTNFSTGMVIRFTKEYKSLDVKKDTYATVVNADKTTGLLHLKTSVGKAVAFDPARIGSGRRGGFEVYTADRRDLSRGDVLRWTSNIRELGVHNTETAEVVDVSEKGATVHLKNSGKTIQLDASNPLHHHFEYAYTSTVYAAQGKTSVAIIMNGDHYRKFLTNQKTFYTGLSRAQYKMFVYVSSKLKYIDAVTRNLGDKTSALEALFGSDFAANRGRNVDSHRDKSKSKDILQELDKASRETQKKERVRVEKEQESNNKTNLARSPDREREFRATRNVPKEAADRNREKAPERDRSKAVAIER